MKRKFILFALVLLFSILCSAWSPKNMWISIEGGAIFSNPSDLNVQSQWETYYFNEYLESYYQYFQDAGIWENFYSTKNGSFPEINLIYPLMIEFGFEIGGGFSISASLFYLKAEKRSSPQFSYFFTLQPYDYETDYVFNTFLVSCKMINPRLNLYYSIINLEKGSIRVEGLFFIGVGYSLAETLISYDLRKEYFIKPDTMLSFYNYSLRMDGDGNGITYHFGLNTKTYIKKHFGINIKVSYDHLKIKKIEGEGSSIYENSSGKRSENWSGRWFIWGKNIQNSWTNGEYQEKVSNSSEDLDYMVRDFILDLSGFSIMFGFFIVF